MNEPVYSLSFEIYYRLSKDNKHFAQIFWRSVSKLPATIVFGFSLNEELSFEGLSDKYRGLTIPRGSILTLNIKDTGTGKSYPYAFDINKDWRQPEDYGGIISRLGSLDITKAIKAVL